jgi:hypothetical protein
MYTSLIHQYLANDITPRPVISRLDPIPSTDAFLHVLDETGRSYSPAEFTKHNFTPIQLATIAAPYLLRRISVQIRLHGYFSGRELMATDHKLTNLAKKVSPVPVVPSKTPQWIRAMSLVWMELDIHDAWRKKFVDYAAYPPGKEPGDRLHGERFYRKVVMGGNHRLLDKGSIFGKPNAPNSLDRILEFSMAMGDARIAKRFIVAICTKVDLPPPPPPRPGRNHWPVFAPW